MALKDQYSVLKYSHLGLSFAIFLGGSFFLGLKADEKFGTGSVLTLLGGAVGLASGFYYLVREANRLTDEDGRTETERDDDDASTEGKP